MIIGTSATNPLHSLFGSVSLLFHKHNRPMTHPEKHPRTVTHPERGASGGASTSGTKTNSGGTKGSVPQTKGPIDTGGNHHPEQTAGGKGDDGAGSGAHKSSRMASICAV
jgi:hypothetical protein